MALGSASVIAQANGKPRELNQGGTSTTETVFTTDGTVPVVAMLPLASALTGANPLTAIKFRVKAWGRVVTAGTYNFTIKLYYGTSATVASDTLISSSGTVSLASLTTNWMVEADLVWDGDSQRINGHAWNQVHTTKEATGTIDNAVTAADPAGTTALGFLVSATFGTGNASNKAYLDGLQIEL